MAGWRKANRIGAQRGGCDQVGCGGAVADGAGEPGRAGANTARLLGRPVVFCGDAGYRGAPSDCPALSRTGPGLWSDGGARRSAEARQETDDHSRSQGMGRGSFLAGTDATVISFTE